MKLKSKFLSLILMLNFMSLLTVYSADNKQTKSFVDILAESKMVYKKPDGLIETTVINNDQMNYEYAIKYPDKNFEVRYAIRPLAAMIDKYKEQVVNKKPGESFVDPNVLYTASFHAIALNISGGKFSGNQDFDKSAAKQDFNADWGSMSFFEVGKSFGQGYKYCLMIAIHKDNCADAYIFFMTDSKEQMMELANPAFYSLKFK